MGFRGFKGSVWSLSLGFRVWGLGFRGFQGLGSSLGLGVLNGRHKPGQKTRNCPQAATSRRFRASSLNPAQSSQEP